MLDTLCPFSKVIVTVSADKHDRIRTLQNTVLSITSFAGVQRKSDNFAIHF